MPLDYKKLNFRFNPYASYQQSAEPQLNQKQIALQRLAQAKMSDEVAKRNLYSSQPNKNIPYEEWLKLQTAPKRVDAMSATQPKTKADKLIEILKNPVTAAQYAINKQDIPNNLSNDRNIYDLATDVLNPAFYGKAITNTAKNVVNPETYKDLGKSLLAGATMLSGDESRDLNPALLNTAGKLLEAGVAIPAVRGLGKLFPKAGTDLFNQIKLGRNITMAPEEAQLALEGRQPLALGEGQVAPELPQVQRQIEAPAQIGEMPREEMVNAVKRMAGQTGFNPAHVNTLTDEELRSLVPHLNDEGAFMENMNNGVINQAHPILNDEQYLDDWLVNGAHPEDMYGPIENSSVARINRNTTVPQEHEYASEEDLNHLFGLDRENVPATPAEPQVTLPADFDQHRTQIINNLLNTPGLGREDIEDIRDFTDEELFHNHDLLYPDEHAQMFGGQPSGIQMPSVSNISGVNTQGMTIMGPIQRDYIISNIAPQTADIDELEHLRRMDDADLLDLFHSVNPSLFDDYYRTGRITGGSYEPIQTQNNLPNSTPVDLNTSVTNNPQVNNSSTLLNEEERNFLKKMYDIHGYGNLSRNPTDRELIDFYNSDITNNQNTYAFPKPGKDLGGQFLQKAIDVSGSQGIYRFREPKIKNEIIENVKKIHPDADISKLENTNSATAFANELKSIIGDYEFNDMVRGIKTPYLENSRTNLRMSKLATMKEAPKSVDDLIPTENGFILNNGLKLNKVGDNIYEAKLGDKSYGFVDRFFNVVDKDGNVKYNNERNVLDKIADGLYLERDSNLDKFIAQDSYGGGDISMRKLQLDENANSDWNGGGDPTWKFYMNMPEQIRAGKSMKALEQYIKKGEFVGQPSTDSYSMNSYFANLARGKNPQKWEPVQKGYIETNSMAMNDVPELAEQGILADQTKYSSNNVLNNITEQVKNKLNGLLENNKLDDVQKQAIKEVIPRLQKMYDNIRNLDYQNKKTEANKLFNQYKKEVKQHAPELLSKLGITSSRSYSSLARLGAENAAKYIDDKIKKQLPNANIGPVKVEEEYGGYKLQLPNIHYKKLFSILGAAGFINAFGKDTYDDMMSGKFDKPTISNKTLNKIKK